MLLQHPYKRTCSVELDLAVKYGLGGRDSLVIANFITNKVPVMYTHDGELLSLREIS